MKRLENSESECEYFQVCPVRRFFNQGLIDEYWVREYCHGDNRSCVRYKKEKAGIFHPDNMLPDGSMIKL